MAADPPELDSYYQGRTCLVHYPGQHCPFPRQCADPVPHSEGERAIRKNGPCIHWRQGDLPNLPSFTSSSIAQGRSRELNINDVFDRNGSWSEEDIWIPNAAAQLGQNHPSDKFRFFTPQETAKCLAGKRILVQGDSMMRQFYNRLIHYMRGIPSSTEKYYGGLSSYTVFANGSDEWELPRSNDNAPYSRAKDLKDDVVFRVLYDWQAEDISDVAGSFKTMIERDVDIAVMGFNYWYPLNFDFSRLPGVIDQFYADNPDWPGIISWYSAPQEFKDKDSWWHVGQGALMRHLGNDRRWREGRRFHTLPSDMMVAAADARDYPQRNCRFDPTEDASTCWHDAHFGSGIQSLFGTPTMPGIMGFKAPLGYDGRDMYNFGVLQVWLNSICP